VNKAKIQQERRHLLKELNRLDPLNIVNDCVVCQQFIIIVILCIEIDEPSAGDTEEDEERDSSSSIRPIRKSIITTRAQAAARNHSNNRRKRSPPKKRPSLVLPPHRPNTRISRRIIEQDLKLLRQANVLPPLSPPMNQQPLDLSLGPSNRSSSFEEPLDKNQLGDQQNMTTTKAVPVEGVLDLSLSR
jgi:hypothetical protein